MNTPINPLVPAWVQHDDLIRQRNALLAACKSALVLFDHLEWKLTDRDLRAEQIRQAIKQAEEKL